MSGPVASSLEEAVKKNWQPEILGFIEEMKTWEQGGECRTVLKRIGGMSARAFEIRIRLIRRPERWAQTFRTQEVDPFLEHCKFQKDIWSRIFETMKSDYEIMRRGD